MPLTLPRSARRDEQVCWKKLAAYWDIEMRLGLLEEGGKYTLEPEVRVGAGMCLDASNRGRAQDTLGWVVVWVVRDLHVFGRDK